MSARKLYITFALIALTFGFTVGVKAQADCRYGLEIYVRDEAGKPIKDAALEASGLTEKDVLPDYVKPRLGFNGAYWMESHAGQTVTGNFMFRVSADGFETYERRFNFPVCDIQKFELRLRPKGSTGEAVFERLFVVHGKVYDEEMKPIADVKIEAVFANGRAYQTSSNQYGYYELGLPKGVATIRATNSKIPDVVFKDFRIEKNYSALNVPVCLKCKQTDSKN